MAAEAIMDGNPVKDFVTDYEVQEIICFAADVFSEWETEYLYESIYEEENI